MIKEPHLVLGVSVDATLSEAKAAYRRLAQLHHPDRPGGDPQKFHEITRALEKFQRKLPCPACAGKGFVELKSGLAVKRENCPLCWSKT